MNSYYYTVLNSCGKKTNSGSVRAESMDAAHEKAASQCDISVKTEYYSDESMMAGSVWRRNLVRRDKRVSLLIGKVL